MGTREGVCPAKTQKPLVEIVCILYWYKDPDLGKYRDYQLLVVDVVVFTIISPLGRTACNCMHQCQWSHNITKRRLHYSRHWKIKAGGRTIFWPHTSRHRTRIYTQSVTQIVLLHFFTLPSSLTWAHFQFFCCLNYFLLVGFY